MHCWPHNTWLHISNKGHKRKAKKPDDDSWNTSFPEAINWGLEQLPNITVQINHSLTRRLTYFLCIKCPLIKLPTWQSPKLQILGPPIMVICPFWATLQTMWCVSSLRQEKRTQSFAVLVWVHFCALTHMLILAYIRLQVKWWSDPNRGEIFN